MKKIYYISVNDVCKSRNLREKGYYKIIKEKRNIELIEKHSLFEYIAYFRGIIHLRLINFLKKKKEKQEFQTT